MAWPDYDQADAFRFNKVINEPDFLPLHVVRQLVQAASLVRAQRGKLVACRVEHLKLGSPLHRLLGQFETRLWIVHKADVCEQDVNLVVAVDQGKRLFKGASS